MIYLDNAATTRVAPETAALISRIMTEEYGNPSSMHRAGFDAEKILRGAREVIARTLGCREKEIYFTSGGTESNNWALLGAAASYSRLGKRVVISSVEHPSVAETGKRLEELGYAVIRIPAIPDGHVDMDALEDALTEDTILVSVMLVNNEVGAVNDPAAISALIRAKSPNAVFHTDAVQAYGKIPIAPSRSGIDLLSVSAHKIHGPKGAGFLYKREGIRIAPLICGGGQQDGLRSGTENVPGIAGLAAAAERACGNLSENAAKMTALRDHFREELSAIADSLSDGSGPACVLHGGTEGFAPHIVNGSFPGIRSEVMLHALEDRGIMCSAGSACSSHKRSESPTLTAMGLSAAEKDSALRFSFCEDNTEEEVEETAAALRELIPALRRYRAR